MKKLVFIFVMLSAVSTGCARQETTWQETYDNGQDYMIAKEYRKAEKYTRFHSGIKGDIPDETNIYRYDRNGETSEYERYQNGELLSKYYYSLTSDSGKTVKIL